MLTLVRREKCDILQSVVKEHGIDQNQEELRNPEYLKDYMESHKVSEFIQVNPLLKNLPGSSDKLVFKFDIKSTCTLADLSKLKLSVAKILNLESAALRLLGIDEGCITVTYLISPSIAGAIFTSDKKFTEKETKEFRALSVQWLKYGGHFSNFEVGFRDESHDGKYCS